MICPGATSELCHAAPLFELETAKFVLPFLVNGENRIQGLESTLRGRTGYLLKARFCPFDDFQDPARDCSRCERSTYCLYPELFKPGDRGSPANKSGHKNVPPPFFLNVFTREDPDAPGETEGNLELTLFGPAMTYFRPLLESVWHGLESLELETGSVQAADRPGILLQNWHCLVPVPEQGVRFLEYPFAEPHHPGHSLEDWIQSDRFTSEHADRIQLDLITPLDIRAKKSAGGLSFTGLIKGVIRRMRDLKRAYGHDSRMGEFSQEFYDLAQSVQVDTGGVRRISWYAPNTKGKRIPLTGLQGEIHIQGELSPFLPFLQAGALIGVGANITYGLGRIGLAEGIEHGAWGRGQRSDEG